MKGRWNKYLLSGLVGMLVGCSSQPTDYGQQYRDGRLDQVMQQVNQPNAKGVLVNAQDYLNQLLEIKYDAPALFDRYNTTYQAVKNWLSVGADTSQLNQHGLSTYQMKGVDNYGNVQFTGYYTPVLQARYTQQGAFRYPLYRMPSKGKKPLPNRASIYSGAMDNRYIIAYSNSLIDNFMMEVQGSGYVDYGNGQPLVFFGYGGRNGYAYRSIGKVLINRGAVAQADMSLQAIHQWAASHSAAELQELLNQNPSFIFFCPEKYASVKGASAVSLIAKASVASDRSLIPAGTTLLAEVPLLDNKGQFTGKYEIRLLIALDVGGAIKGQHFDLYQGIGPAAGHSAGYYKHYGRVWVLSATSDAQLSVPTRTAVVSLLNH